MDQLAARFTQPTRQAEGSGRGRARQPIGYRSAAVYRLNTRRAGTNRGGQRPLTGIGAARGSCTGRLPTDPIRSETRLPVSVRPRQTGGRQVYRPAPRYPPMHPGWNRRQQMGCPSVYRLGALMLPCCGPSGGVYSLPPTPEEAPHSPTSDAVL